MGISTNTISTTYYPQIGSTTDKNIRIEEDSSGSLHAIWLSQVSSVNKEIYYSKSIDSGVTWEAPTQIYTGATTLGGGTLRMVIAPNGTIHVWAFSGTTVYYIRYLTVGGWQAPNTSWLTSVASPESAASVDSSNIVTFFYSNGTSNYYVKMTYSTDDGANWTNNATWQAAQWPLVSDAISSGGTTYVIWYNSRSGYLAYKCFSGTYSGGWTWSDTTFPAEVDAPAAAWYTRLLVDSTGDIRCLYYNQTDSKIIYSKYASSSWSALSDKVTSTGTLYGFCAGINSEDRIVVVYQKNVVHNGQYYRDMPDATLTMSDETEAIPTANTLYSDSIQHKATTPTFAILFKDNTSAGVYSDVLTFATLEIEDINNDFRAKVTTFFGIVNNDFRCKSGLTYYDVNNDIRFGGVEADDINNDFRCAEPTYDYININNDFRILIYTFIDISNKIECHLPIYYNINNNFKTKIQELDDIRNDFRMLHSWQIGPTPATPDPVPSGEPFIPGPTAATVNFQSRGKKYVTVSISSIDQTLVDVDSIQISENLNASAMATFILAKPYDTDMTGTDITQIKPVIGSAVIIKYDEYTIFTGYVSSVQVNSSPENIQVTCSDSFWLNNNINVNPFSIGHLPKKDTIFIPSLGYSIPSELYNQGTMTSLEGESYDVYSDKLFVDTISEGLSLLGFTAGGVGNFVPDNIEISNTGISDAIVSLLSEAGNYGFFYKNAIQRLHVNGSGNEVDIPMQTLGTNFDLYQMISLNVGPTKDKIVNTAVVDLGSLSVDSSNIPNNAILR